MNARCLEIWQIIWICNYKFIDQHYNDGLLFGVDFVIYSNNIGMRKIFIAALAALFIMTSCGGNALDKALSQCEEAIEQLEKAKTADEADKAREAVSAAFNKMSVKETFDV